MFFILFFVFIVSYCLLNSLNFSRIVCSKNDSKNEWKNGVMFYGEARPNLGCDFALSATRRWSGNNFLDTSGEFHAEAARVAVDALAHVRHEFHPFGQPKGAGFAAVMPKCDHTDDAVNAAIPRIAFVRTIIDVVFGGDGGVGFGDVFQRAAVVVQNANAAEFVSPIGFKYR